jgi:predicted nucleic acid-binding protein
VTVTCLDAGVLIAVVRDDRSSARRALVLLEDTERTFVASAFLRLELLPKAIYHRNESETRFYEAFFDRVSHWAEPIDHVVEIAEREAARHGLSALDALHVATAMILGAEELWTTEGPHKPIHRVTSTSLRVMTL